MEPTTEVAAAAVVPCPLTDEQHRLSTAPFERGSRSVVRAPAGSGKTTVMVRLAKSRTEAGLRCAVVAQYNATIVAFHMACTGQGFDHALVPVYTLNKFAKWVNETCRTGSRGPPVASSLSQLWEAGDATHFLPRLSNVFAESGDALAKAILRSVPRSASGPLPAPVVSALSDMVDAREPPEFLTWAGLYVRWRRSGGARAPGKAWETYAACVEAALQPYGDSSPEALCQADLQRSGAPCSRVSVWDFVMAWQALAAVRHGLYDPFYNAHRLELAWFPERFDLQRGRGLLDVLIMDEAQDMPLVDSVYLPRLHGPRAWDLEAWYVGDPNQQIHDYRDSINMLQADAGNEEESDPEDDSDGLSGGDDEGSSTVDSEAETVAPTPPPTPPPSPRRTREFCMTVNFRNPKTVARALKAHVRGLPPMTIAREGGSVQYLSRAPLYSELDGALVMFRGNASLLVTAAEYFAATGRPVGVSLATHRRVCGAWRRWCADRFEIRASSLKACLARALKQAAGGLSEEAASGEGALAMDVASAVACTSEQGFLEAFGLARGRVLEIMKRDPSEWLHARDEAHGFAEEGGTPLFTTVHSCKGQGHQDVVLMPGIMCTNGSSSAPAPAPAPALTRGRHPAAAVPGRRCLMAAATAEESDSDGSPDSNSGGEPSELLGDPDACRVARKCEWVVDTPEGRLLYTAISRSSRDLRIVVMNHHRGK